jgi:hypothetical protein
LPSSTQLQSTLNAGTYARTRALVKDIFEILPRWVPSSAFYEARQILDKEHVCVIAGVPGIGKTTLAKMLLADSIDLGYEAIQVSSDIEEAWKVFEPGIKQAFYYDDFLGRAALTERYNKNEEDRLLMFMHRIAASKTTLFILTTREYILQQARQLYEKLDFEGIEKRKLLLRLDHYSRIDRARIFYNHAFFSNQLSKKARRGLLRDRAYLKIIDHPKYNPRQIEWITGLSSYELNAHDNENYVSFALSAMDDPIRIWRHGFEQQLNDIQRALLLVLDSIPDKAEHEDLQKAFIGFCSAGNLDTKGRAFERALEVLDDSFVRTFHDVGLIFITVYNPAVEDFLAAYIKSSQTDAKIAVNGAVFFEQIERLGYLLKTPEIPPAWLADDFVRALSRCANAPSCSWYQVYYGRDAEEPTTTRRDVSLEYRVNYIGRMKSWGLPYCKQPLLSEICSIYEQAKTVAIERWSKGQGDRGEAIKLLTMMLGRREDIVDALKAIKKLIATNLHYTQAFSYVLSLRKSFPNAYDKKEWAALQQSFSTVAQEDLDNWNEMTDSQEVSDIEVYAELMGVDLDPHEIQRTRERVEENVAEAEDKARRRGRKYQRTYEPVESDEGEAEIESIFIRLASE